MTSDQSLWLATNLLQLPAAVFSTILLHPQQLLLRLKTVTICHKTGHLLPSQWLTGSIHNDPITPWFIWFGGSLTQTCRPRLFPLKQLLILRLHRVNPGQNFPLSIVKEATIWRFYKRLTTLVLQATKSEQQATSRFSRCMYQVDMHRGYASD